MAIILCLISGLERQLLCMQVSILNIRYRDQYKSIEHSVSLGNHIQMMDVSIAITDFACSTDLGKSVVANDFVKYVMNVLTKVTNSA